jgi:hypothetical protein
MKSIRARQILSCYRPGIDDASEPDVAEALSLLKSDAGLRSWWENQMAVHDALRSKFRSLPVAEGLKEQIISERPAFLTSRPARKLALAAVAALILFFGFVTIKQQMLTSGEAADFANFQNRMVRKIVREYPRMDLETDDQKRIHEFLAAHGGLQNYDLPKPLLAQATSTGCAIIRWQGREVSMICYNSGSTKDVKSPDLFLFAIPRDKVAGAATPNFPRHDILNGMPVVSWVSGNTVFLLASNGPDELVRRFSGFTALN